MDSHAAYQSGKEAAERRVAAFERRSRVIGLARLLVFGGAIVLLGFIVWGGLPSQAWMGEGALFVLFVVLVVVHARIEDQKERAKAALRFHLRGLDRLAGKWAGAAPTGDRFRSVDHPFSEDLDIFGHASLFQRIDATETRFGEERLAAWLTNTGDEAFPDAILERQAAVRDLSPRVAFRETLSALGAMLSEEKPDPRPFITWAEGKTQLPTWVVWPARLLPIVFVLLAAFGPALHVPKLWTYVTVMAELLLLAAVQRLVGPIVTVVSARESGLTRYAEILEALEREPFEAARLRALQARLRPSGGAKTATEAMRGFSRIVGFLDARHNEVFRFTVGVVLLWDLNCVIALERWRRQAGDRVREWFEVLGEVEALASLAGYAFERPSHAWPELSRDPVLDARGLGHPLLADDRRVDNDVSLGGAGHAYIVTGSNMSGKSTLLRAMGINAVLARAGAPVCARALRIGPLRVATSMRVSDSLEQGISHFYAELQKLKKVIDMARARGPASGQGTVLFLLDEVLHGTNSRERILGARAILRELVTCGATGAISTHDLGISDIERELGGAVKNVHFEEQVDGEKMTFDYRLRAGVVQSSNALRLMKLVGIDVVEV